MKKHKNILCIVARHTMLYALVFAMLPAYTQQNKIVNYSFISDTVYTAFGQTFSNKLQVNNNCSETVTLTKIAVNTPGVLIDIPASVTLLPGDKKLLPVKYFASSATIFTGLQKITVHLYAAPDIVINDSAFFFVKTNMPENIFITSPEPVIYFDPVSARGIVRAKCINNGYSEKAVKLSVNAYPYGLRFSQIIQDVILKPGETQMVIFNIQAPLQKVNATDFTINITATDIQGYIVAINTVQAISLNSSKRLTAAGNLYAGMYKNTIELNAVNTTDIPSFYQFHVNGVKNITDSAQLDYNVNFNYYANGNTEAYDTWLAFSNKTFAVKAGNIFENLDYALYGRGVKASAMINKKSSVDLYWLDNNYLLFSSMNQLVQQPSRTWAGSYTFGQSANTGGKISLVHSHNLITNQLTNLLTSQARFILKKQATLDVQAGYSYESLKDLSGGVAGYAAGFLYMRKLKRWNIVLSNYISTPYYSGLRRGTIQLDEQFTYTIKKNTDVFARYNKLSNKPQYLSGFLLSNGRYNDISNYQLGVNTNLSGNFSLGLHPYISIQHVNQPLNTNVDTQHSASIRTELNIRYTSGTKTLSLGIDYGLVNSTSPIYEKYQSARIIADYNSMYWGINAYIQTGPFYLMDEFILPKNGKYRVYSFGPYAHFTAWKIEVSVSDYINYSGYSLSWNNSLNGQLKYSITRSCQLSAQSTYNRYNNTQYMQTRLGVIKQFAQHNSPGFKDLEIIFFGDVNANGSQDAGEKEVEGVTVNVAGSMAVSNKKGKVNYSNLGEGEQSIQVVNAGEWHLLYPVAVLLKHNQKINIPLVKSTRIYGKVKAEQQKFILTKAPLEGIRVNATDADNRIFSTLTDEAGSFSFMLPVKEYIFTIESAGHRFSISNPNQSINIKKENNPEIIFNLTDNSRKVDVKSF